jgi:hypothetical protein
VGIKKIPRAFEYMCDGCGARVPIELLSLVTFIEGEGFACEECQRDTVVVAREGRTDA